MHSHLFKIKNHPFAISSAIGILSVYQTKTCICGFTENKVIQNSVNIKKWNMKNKEANEIFSITA